MVIYILLILFLGLAQQGYSTVNIIELPKRIENNHPYLILGDIFPQETLGISALDRSRVLLKMPPPGQEIILKSEDIQHFLTLYAIDIPVILRDIKIGSFEASSSSAELIKSVQGVQAVNASTKAPVLNRLMMPTEIISTDDIQWVDMELEDITAACALKIEDLIHFTPIQPLQPGTLVKKSLLKKPKVIQRGNLISLVLQTPYMVLTQRKAQAMEDGAVGERIKVCNLDTKRIIMGIVKNNTVVEVHL